MSRSKRYPFLLQKSSAPQKLRGVGCFEIEKLEKFLNLDDENEIDSTDSKKVSEGIHRNLNDGDIERASLHTDLSTKHKPSGNNRVALSQLTAHNDRYVYLAKVGKLTAKSSNTLMNIDLLHGLLEGDVEEFQAGFKFITRAFVSFVGSRFLKENDSALVLEGLSRGYLLKFASPYVAREWGIFNLIDLCDNYKEYQKEPQRGFSTVDTGFSISFP